MKNSFYNLLFLPIVSLVFLNGCQAQEYGNHLLKLQNHIDLPNVVGRIDHIDINIKDKIVYIAALGNNTLEVVDLKSGKVSGKITGLDEPQGVAYIDKHKELVIANGGTGECRIYNALTLKQIGSIQLNDDADDVRYDSETDKIYVGYGSGGIAIIDASTLKLIGKITLPAHPESFQLDTKLNKLWVNLPGSGMIGVCNLMNLKLTTKWTQLLPRANFPMAYNEIQHRLIIGYRIPAKLIVYNSETGKEIVSAPMVGDADDIYWDKRTKEIYISGGGGFINIFKQSGGGFYTQIANIKTRKGARTSLLVPELGLFLIAANSNKNEPGTLMIYKTMK